MHGPLNVKFAWLCTKCGRSVFHCRPVILPIYTAATSVRAMSVAQRLATATVLLPMLLAAFDKITDQCVSSILCPTETPTAHIFLKLHILYT